MAPWLVEDAPALWMDRRQEWAKAKNEQQEYSLKKSERKSSGRKGGKQRRKLF